MLKLNPWGLELIIAHQSETKIMEQRIESTKFIAKWTVTYASMFTRAAVGKLLYNPDTNKDIANDNESEKRSTGASQ